MHGPNAVDTVALEALSLIVDQGDERVDDKRDAGCHQTCQLVDQALAGARRQKDDRVCAAQNLADRRKLSVTEALVTEHIGDE